jgi:hypothetical protein
VATLNGTILKSDGSAPSPWSLRDGALPGCPISGPIANARPGDIHFVAAKSHIYFRLVGAPFVDGAAGGAVVAGGATRALIDPKTGAFSATLLAGNYRCTVGADEFDINIPADAGVFNLSDAGIITGGLAVMPPASNANQGTYPAGAEDFVLPANAVGAIGNPVATGWTQTVYGPGKFQISAVLSILATSRGGGAEDNDIFTAYIWDSTHGVQIGQAVTVQTIFTGDQGQLLLTGTIMIAGASNVLLEVYAAGNPTAADPTPAPDSVGTIVMEQSSISIARLS